MILVILINKQIEFEFELFPKRDVLIQQRFFIYVFCRHYILYYKSLIKGFK